MGDAETADLVGIYRAYIACLNAQDWARLDRFVRVDVIHNGRDFGLEGYRAMLEADFAAIPDLRFDVEMLICQPPTVASRLRFDCTPSGPLFGLPVDGRRVVFAEHVFYRFEDGRIAEARSVIDKAAIEAQLRAGTSSRGVQP